MAYSFSPKVVTDGLVLYLDAANPKSYASGSSIWSNLTPNLITGSLINGPVFDLNNLGSIQFDGVDDYAQIENSQLLNSSAGCVSIWFNYSIITGIYGPSLVGKADIVESKNGYNVIIEPPGNIYTQIKNAGSQMNTTASPVSQNTWYNYAFCYTSGQTCSTYLNGKLIANQAVLTFSISSAQPMRLADSLDFFWGIFGGKIASLTVYSKRLSDAEVLQNYNATKGRFGL